MKRRFLAPFVVLALVLTAVPPPMWGNSFAVTVCAAGSFTAEAMSLPLLDSRPILSALPVSSRLGSLRSAARLSFKDSVFLAALSAILTEGLMLDFKFFDGWVTRNPQLILLSFMPVSIVTAFAADLGAQWLEMKIKAPHQFFFRNVSLRRVANLIVTGIVYSATVESLIYVSGLHSLGIAPLWRALLDIVLISPWITDPLSYFMYANYIEGGGEEDAVAQIRENGVRIYAKAAPFWFLTTWRSMSSADPTVSFIWLSLGVLIWNIIFSLDAGEKNTPLPHWLSTLLRPVQAYYEWSRFGLSLRWKLKLSFMLVLTHQFVLLQVPLLSAYALAMTIVVGLHAFHDFHPSIAWSRIGRGLVAASA